MAAVGSSLLEQSNGPNPLPERPSLVSGFWSEGQAPEQASLRLPRLVSVRVPRSCWPVIWSFVDEGAFVSHGRLSGLGVESEQGIVQELLRYLSSAICVRPGSPVQTSAGDFIRS